MSNGKYFWDPDTIGHFQFLNSYLSDEDVYKKIQEFVEVSCSLEDGETEGELVSDLYKQVFTN